MHRKPTSPRRSSSGHSKGILARIRAEFFATDPLCFYCRCLTQLPSGDERYPNTATVDHKTPISRGGHKARRSNLALCCLACNHAKADSSEEEFRALLNQNQSFDSYSRALRLFPTTRVLALEWPAASSMLSLGFEMATLPVGRLHSHDLIHRSLVIPP